MSRPSDTIDEVVRDHVAPAMKVAEFRKTARSWHSDLGHVVRVVNLQGSAWNSDTRARFTLNLGLWFPEAAEIAGTPAPRNRRPPEHLCTVRERIGQLMPDSGDVWWELTSSRDVAHVGPQVSVALVEHGLPWLDRCSDPLAAFEWLRDRDYRAHSPVMAFALALSAGRADLARDAYVGWAAKPDVLPDGRIHDWARSHSLA
jgi:hypothetical protein